MAKEITRSIARKIERELWARAAGRCQFAGCNRLLYESPVTQERVSIAEQAHIYSFSQDGPRGWGPSLTRRAELNDIGNLMLACHDCHRTIDQDIDGTRYPASLLKEWKDAHEQRVRTVTGIHPSKRSHVLLYGAKIGEQNSRLPPATAMEALFPDWYPASASPIELSMVWERADDDPSFWLIEDANLVTHYTRKVRPLIETTSDVHISVFALAPIPLLIRLGTLLSDQTPAEVYQLHREPTTWRWLDDSADIQFRIVRPEDTVADPALVLSLSDSIDHSRVRDILGATVPIWELTLDAPHNDFLKSRKHLVRFREVARQLLGEIGRTHGKHAPVAVFPAMPVACAVELGRVRMPKADSRWQIYDYSNRYGRFIPTLTLGT